MSLIPNTSLGASAAGAPLSKTAGSTAERARQDAGAQQRTQETDLKAEEAAGIGHTEEDQETSERDADGRRLWEKHDWKKPSDEEAASKQAKDPSGTMGGSIDLTG